MSLNWLFVRRFIYLLFVPATIGLAWHALYSATLAQQLLASALVLFCIELAIMAKVDLDSIAAVREAAHPLELNQPLNQFLFVVVSTVVLELLGFYAALFSLPIGALVVVFSQLWFNLLAQIQLRLGQSPALIPFSIAQRLPVVLANGLGLGLISLWFAPTLSSILPLELSSGIVMQMRRWISGGLLALVLLFLLVKYLVVGVLPITNNHQKDSKSR